MAVRRETLTVIPSNYDGVNSVYNGVLLPSNIAKGYTDTSSTTYCQIYLVTGAGAETYFYYQFDLSAIPENATIISVSCKAKIYISVTQAAYIEAATAQLCSGVDTKGSPHNVVDSTAVFNITAGEWTRDELQNAAIRMYAKRGTSSTSIARYFRFYGAELTIEYDVPIPDPLGILDTDLASQLPPWYRQILDYQAICSTEQQRFDALASAIYSVSENFFFDTMTETGLTMWEEVYGILADPAVEDVEFRRARLFNRISTQPPFNLQFLENKLDELIGPGQWDLLVDYANYTLYIAASADSQEYATEVAYTIGRIKPAHIAYVNQPFSSSTLLISETISNSKLVYKYSLGGWGLGIEPFAAEQGMGVIKTASVSSIRQELLNDVATYITTDVSSALINGSISVPVTVTANGSTLTVTYDVTPADTAAVTSVALVDSNSDVLTTATVYVPISSSTQFKHVMTVKEGA